MNHSEVDVVCNKSYLKKGFSLRKKCAQIKVVVKIKIYQI
jgi:phage FluMu protein Com